jgi:hypothetical protein
MSRAFLQDLLRGTRCRNRKSTNSVSCRRNGDSLVSPVKPLDARLVPAAIATLNGGTPSVFGESLGDTITISRDTAGDILVNGHGVQVRWRTPTVASTNLIQVFAQGGNNHRLLPEASRTP